MNIFNHTYNTIKNLEQLITKIDNHKTIFIQIFCGDLISKELQEILDLLCNKLPLASIIGSSTAGEIINGEISRNSILLSFSVFDNVDIKTYYFPKSDFSNGVKAAKKIVEKNTKACIIFSGGLKGDAESFLNGFSSINTEIPIAGGNAGDNFNFKQTFVIESNKIYFDGIVIATLNSDSLHVATNYSLGWTPVGKEMTITKADKNIVYEIDNQPIKEVFAHYLGEEAIQNIPQSAIEFPLIKVENRVEIARSMVAKIDDDGYIFAGHFTDGDRVKFSIGNVEEILNSASKIQSKIAKNPTEGTYIYSCSVRDMFLKEQLNYEFGLIENIAPTSGFFTYGEFFHSQQKRQLLNVTTTTISLSESTKLVNTTQLKKPNNNATMLKSLTNLVNVTQKELDKNISVLSQYKNALDESSVVSKTDSEGFITYVNDTFCKISGYNRDELIGKTHSIIRHPDTTDQFIKDLWGTIKSGKIWHGVMKNRKKDGNEYTVKSVIVPIFDNDGDIIEYMAVRTDITDIVKKDQIIKESTVDRLTGIKNRQALMSILSKEENIPSLLLINIDRFSLINSYFGYDIGDELLKLFAKNLKKITQHQELFRISGDEFAILCMDTKYSKKLKEKILQIITNLEAYNYKIKNYKIIIRFTCGVSYGKSHEVYRLAHIALNEAKEQNKKIVFFNENKYLEEKIKNNIEIVEKIRDAIEENRIVPFFQGIVDNKSRKIIKYESLMRLIDIDGSVISPFFFLEHAKKSKLYDGLTHIMIKKTFSMFENSEFDFSINLTISDILSYETRKILFENIKKYKCGNRLIIEMVESEQIENFKEVLFFINQVKEYGCKIAIDDFGSGYSNFSYLEKLKVDFIKIDGSLIKDINKDENKKNIVKSILLFSKSQNIKTIAEFVENEEVFNVLVELGVDFSQGYLFSKPSNSLMVIN